MKLPTDTAVFQNSWIVPDIETTAMDWVNTFNIGPFFVGEYGPEQLVDVTYRGHAGEMNMLVALAQAGPMQIELIQPLSDSPCAYWDTVKPGESRFHHVCVWSDDLDADLAYYTEKGFKIANTGRVIESSRFAYVDTHDKLNCMIEILEHHEMVEGIFKMIADTCASWDGKDPIRSY